MKTVVKHINNEGLFQVEDILLALDILAQGGIIAFPTDTVYGLAALPQREDAIQRLYDIKGRSSKKAIAILVGRREDVCQIASHIPEYAQHLMDTFWSGALTIVLERNTSLPHTLSPKPTIGVRMPNHRGALQLLNLSGPLAVTSANLSEQASATNAAMVLAQIGDRFELLLDGGETPAGVSSTVVDCTQAEVQILREGPISAKEITRISKVKRSIIIP